MDPDFVFCPSCGHRMRQSRISIDASGPGFTVTITGIQVFACDTCRTSLRLIETGPGVHDIATTVMNALDRFTPIGLGSPMTTPCQCRKCKSEMSIQIDEARGYFKGNAPLKPGDVTIGVIYHGDAITCPSCGERHPHLPATTYHELANSIERAASIYL